MQPLNTTRQAQRGVDHRLRAGHAEVDDRQPAVAERHRPAGPDARSRPGPRAWRRHARSIRSQAATSAYPPSNRISSGQTSDTCSRSSSRCVGLGWARRSGSPMIQVSLAPPPREELTTRLPSGATRVRARSASVQSSGRGAAHVDEGAQVDVPGLQPARRRRWGGRTARRPPGPPSRPGSAAIWPPAARRPRTAEASGPISTPCPPCPSTGLVTSSPTRSSTIRASASSLVR